MSLYTQRGVSAQKEEVHKATEKLDKGLYPFAFCKLYPDYISGDDNWINVMHADGAGTKSILAYLYWKETDDISVWKGIAQDAIVMNLDDLLCTGITDNILFSSTIDRNKRLIPGEVLSTVIDATQAFFDTMKNYGVNIHYLGGETADVGDVVRTIAVNGTMTARWPKNKVISNEKIQAGDVIIGFAGYGTCTYDNQYNSGIGSNGLTSARHDALDKFYARSYPESFDPGLNESVVYIGPHKLTDKVITESGQEIEVGKLLLSPTRTYAPLLQKILATQFDAAASQDGVHAIQQGRGRTQGHPAAGALPLKRFTQRGGLGQIGGQAVHLPIAGDQLHGLFHGRFSRRRKTRSQGLSPQSGHEAVLAGARPARLYATMTPISARPRAFE